MLAYFGIQGTRQPLQDHLSLSPHLEFVTYARHLSHHIPAYAAENALQLGGVSLGLVVSKLCSLASRGSTEEPWGIPAQGLEEVAERAGF